MKRLCVGGAWSSCGKTATMELLLAAFPGWGAIKLTPTRPDEVCPLGTDCGACSGLDVPFELIEDLDRLAVTGKDTWRFLQARAGKVLWARSQPEALASALAAALERMAGLEGVLIESTSAIPYFDGATVLVTRPDQPLVKDSARSAGGRIDLLAINLSPGATLAEAPHPLAATLAPRQSVGFCAVRPPDDVVNRDFVAACRRAL